MAGIEIRESTIEDADEIGRINALTWEDSYQGIVSDAILEAIDIQERIKWQKEMYDSPKKKSFAAIMDDKIVGYCNLGPIRQAGETPWVANSSFHGNEEEWGEVYAIYVLRSYSRLGIGKSLLVKAREALAALGYKQFQVYVLVNNVPAINFYKSQGGIEQITRDWNYMGEVYQTVGIVF